MIDLRLSVRIDMGRWRAQRGLFAGFAATACILLSACMQPSYQPQTCANQPQTLPALTLIQAEQKGYSEGLAAGERIEAGRERAAEAIKEKQAASPSAESGTAVGNAEAAPVSAIVAPQAPPEFSYSPAGPAIPVVPTPQANCKKSTAAVCD